LLPQRASDARASAAATPGKEAFAMRGGRLAIGIFTLAGMAACGGDGDKGTNAGASGRADGGLTAGAGGSRDGGPMLGNAAGTSGAPSAVKLGELNTEQRMKVCTWAVAKG
jgi:hypothetical protein